MLGFRVSKVRYADSTYFYSHVAPLVPSPHAIDALMDEYPNYSSGRSFREFDRVTDVDPQL